MCTFVPNAERVNLSGQTQHGTVLDAIGKKGVVKVYLAGPMRGLPEYNFPTFTKTAQALREKGYEVWSPHEDELDQGFNPRLDSPKTIKEYMARDLPAVLQSDVVALLPGWTNSEGTYIELFVARTCGIDVRLVEDLLADDEGISNEGSRD